MEHYDEYDEFLNSVYGDVNLGNFTFDPARIIKELDPIAYRVGYADFTSEQNYDEEES